MQINATLIVQIINFVIFFIIVKVFLIKPLMNVIQIRQEKIISFIVEAENVRDDAEKMKKKFKEKLSQMQIEGSKILKEYREEGERIKEEKIHKGREESRRILDHAVLEIKYKKDRVSREMKAQVMELAVDISKKALSDYLDMDKQQELAEKLAEKVELHYDS